MDGWSGESLVGYGYWIKCCLIVHGLGNGTGTQLTTFTISGEMMDMETFLRLFLRFYGRIS